MTKSKIALAVNYDYHDYGGMLQAFATQVALTKMGIPSEVIDFDNLKGDINKRKWKYFLSNITDITIVKEKGKVLAKRLTEKFNPTFSKKIAQRDAAFDKFCKEHFVVSRKFESWQDLTNACYGYKAVIVGSDQLWLPSNVVADYYTLSFVPQEVRKIAYATSFGIGAVPKGMEQKYTDYLSRIDYLSARETSGQEIIKKCVKRNVPLVCDPTLLVEREDWEKVVTPRRYQEKYIFCYFMGDNPEQREFVKRLAKEHDCKIVALLHLDQHIASDEDYVDYAPYDISPADFVSLVKNAEYVCTDSFHGTVFSIIFSKTFFTFRRFNKKASLSTNTRITSLLHRLGLEDRLFSGSEDTTKDWQIKNYAAIQDEVTAFRNASRQYLTDALK